ncbi:MAG: hypothetical protein GXP19_00385 [Gammaproteobacteria bacterium]|nr:hypothetical protein [Gammaproteobacteria bacterium]
MESYIVRIYRQEDARSEKMVGVAIEPGEDKEHVFNNVFELYKLLTAKKNIAEKPFICNDNGTAKSSM